MVFRHRYGSELGFNACCGVTESKASYSGETYTDSGKKIERIDWNEGDRIGIFCRQASAPDSHYGEYSVYSVSASGSVSRARIAQWNPGETGLRWGSGVHNFYAVYPSPCVGGSVISLGAETEDGNDVKARILRTQTYSSLSSDSGNYTASPDLDKSMVMVADSSVDADAASSDEVTLSFRPLVTAIEFTITNDTGKELEILSVGVFSESQPLAGPFSFKIGDDIVDGYETCTYGESPVADADKAVATEFASGTVKLAYSAQASEKKTLTFTLFLNPQGTPEDLTFRIRTSEHTLTTKLATRDPDTGELTGLPFPCHKKTNVTGLFVPEGALWYVTSISGINQWDKDGTGDETDINLHYPSASEEAYVSPWNEGDSESYFWKLTEE